MLSKSIEANHDRPELFSFTASSMACWNLSYLLPKVINGHPATVLGYPVYPTKIFFENKFPYLLKLSFVLLGYWKYFLTTGQNRADGYRTS
jgi:hypothetical protein